MERPGQQECSLTSLFPHLRLVYNTMFSVGDSLTGVSGTLFRHDSCSSVCDLDF